MISERVGLPKPGWDCYLCTRSNQKVCPITFSTQTFLFSIKASQPSVHPRQVYQTYLKLHKNNQVRLPSNPPSSHSKSTHHQKRRRWARRRREKKKTKGSHPSVRYLLCRHAGLRYSFFMHAHKPACIYACTVKAASSTSERGLA